MTEVNKKYRLTSIEEPTDEMLQELMEDVTKAAREYEKSVNKELNLYQHCISSIEKNGHLYKEAIEAAVKMTSGIILPATTLATTSLLMAMFKSVPANTVLKLYMFAYRFSDNITYREALTNALRIYRPDFFHEGLQSGM